MSDQADGLRELMAEIDDDGTTHDPVTRELDYRRLWNDLKAELDRESMGIFRNVNERFNSTPDSRGAHAFLNRMEQSETFARVRKELEVKS